MRAIELRGVSFAYEGYEKKVLKEVDFSLDYGEIALLSGLSGEGKSTLLSLICGIIPNIVPGEISGEVWVDGERILRQRMSAVCRKVGVVLQNADAQIIQQTVEDEIAFGCENFAFSRERISEEIARACELMSLSGAWRTRSLSGGQKQRLITASTLATGQKILILDEPLANLDKAGTALLMNALQALARVGYAVLVVEHRLDTVLSYLDTVWNISGGRVEKIEDKTLYLASQSAMITDDCEAYLPQEKLLDLECVHKRFKSRQILRGVSFALNKGERAVLLGENGCGKTTLMRLISRLSAPSSGRITQFIDPKLRQKTRGNKAWFRRVGIVYQNPNYQLFMPTVEAEVSYGAASKETAEQMLDLFGIGHLAGRHPHALSEGQKRRVSIAAVAAALPELLILDEPTVGQDYAGLKNMVRVLNDLHRKTGNTMLTVTHDMRCAEALCDKAVLIADGLAQRCGGKALVREYFGVKNCEITEK